MRWLHTEYLLKGLYLGLVLYAALKQAAVPQADWATLLLVNATALGGLAVALAVAAAIKMREGYRPHGHLLVFALFLLLESPALVYAGILGGTLGGTFLIPGAGMDGLLAPTLGGGVVLGIGFDLLQYVRRRGVRRALILGLATCLVVAALLWLGYLGDFTKTYPLEHPALFGTQLMLGIPFFFLLTFAGLAEESEVEIGAACALLGLGMATLPGFAGDPRWSRVPFVLAIGIYLVYVVRILPGLRVLKHVFRGKSYARIGRHRLALQSYRRALQLDPKNSLAREGYWEIHRALDLHQLANDPETLALVDLDLCLDRAAALLVEPHPTAGQLDEAHRLLELVVSQRPGLAPAGDYWRAVAYVHAQDYDRAAVDLQRLLDPSTYGRDDPQRLAMLLPGWQLALTLHEQMRQRVGEPQLSRPGRRMEAIAAVERQMAATPEDPEVMPLKRLLYHDLTEEEYAEGVKAETKAAEGEGQAPTLPPFDYHYVRHLGQALLNDPQRWRRGAEYFRMAAHGLPALGPTFYVQIAQTCDRNGDPDGAWHHYELAKRCGRAVGARNLADPERETYFAVVKMLADYAKENGNVEAAIENYHYYAESERSGVETLRTLADLYEQKGDAFGALRVNDQALLYNGRDKDLLARKDRYYYSVMPEELKPRLEWAKTAFDVDYCLRKAKSILDSNFEDYEWLDVANHLVQLALTVRPEDRMARVLLARVKLRLGEREEALALLGGAREPRPEKFVSSEDEDAWYTSCQMLGDLYAEAGRPDQAISCYTDFRKSAKSGARTLYKLGQAYEQLGDPVQAKKFYKQVTAYDGNPLTSDAYDALHRLETGG
jgi:tetratricopeptide (TPR) repeat protein